MSRSTAAAFRAFPALFIAFGLVAQDSPGAAPAVQRITLQEAVQTALKNNLRSASPSRSGMPPRRVS